MSACRIAVVGGGAAGFFGAITCAEARPGAEIVLFEKSSHFLSKVRISGGGRCNVTFACFNPKEFALHYPRGGRELIGPLTRFQARDTVAWFARRGVALKSESDGRMFPASDSAATIVDCLVQSARAAGVRLYRQRAVERAAKTADGFDLKLSTGESITCERLLVATGGGRSPASACLARDLGHTIAHPVPSLFSFHLDAPWLRPLAGVSVERVELSVPGTELWESGALLITHHGLSGPAILRLSAWGARELHEQRYRFPLRLNWLPQLDREALGNEIARRRRNHPAQLVAKAPVDPLANRLWGTIAAEAGIPADMRWGELPRGLLESLTTKLSRTELRVVGKSLNKEEFVTCGGVRLAEVDFRSMESRSIRGLYFAGEVLDIDGITGGFNFQAAWTTAWIAGQSMSRE